MRSDYGRRGQIQFLTLLAAMQPALLSARHPAAANSPLAWSEDDSRPVDSACPQRPAWWNANHRAQGAAVA